MPSPGNDPNRNRKNFAVLMILVGLMALVFAITIMKMAIRDQVSGIHDEKPGIIALPESR